MQPNEKNPKIHTEHWVQSEPPKSFLTDASTIGAIAGSIFGAAIGAVAGGATLAGLLGGGALGGGIGDGIQRWRTNHPAKND